MPALTYYLPITSMMFLYIKILYLFNDDTKEVPDYFYNLFYIITVKSALTVFYFHISFYSARVACWDKIGIYVHLVCFCCMNILGPILMLVFGLGSIFSDNVSPFH